MGAASCGETREEAAANLKEVLELIMDEIEEGEIDWPVAPGVPHWEFSRPSIQDAPEFVRLKCAPEYAATVAAHGGLPVEEQHPIADSGDCYRLIYIAMDDVLAAIHARRTLMATRTGGRVARIFTPPTGKAPVTSCVSRGEGIRANKLPAN